eukprot:CAMPEP_0167813360 /NCGR_PEP_ID=MMETSP0112_2-20121227/1805_1 /TAXON_ID=91324 /ORGANISM="Lotharella globosa, Strain CCCM811" /LENGTH=97 /DNA_ID=CAMNT_0007712423 /DNA_START=489 /DNA_END=779 /DNA_ORIENTATION=+
MTRDTDIDGIDYSGVTPATPRSRNEISLGSVLHGGGVRPCVPDCSHVPDGSSPPVNHSHPRTVPVRKPNHASNKETDRTAHAVVASSHRPERVHDHG